MPAGPGIEADGLKMPKKKSAQSGRSAFIASPDRRQLLRRGVSLLLSERGDVSVSVSVPERLFVVPES